MLQPALHSDRKASDEGVVDPQGRDQAAWGRQTHRWTREAKRLAVDGLDSHHAAITSGTAAKASETDPSIKASRYPGRLNLRRASDIMLRVV